MMNHPKNPKGILRAFAEAVKENKQLRLRMIGPTSNELISYSKALNINEFIVFTGLINQKEVANLLQQSDAFILFSFYENMPCVIAEALCCGLPVISTNVGGIKEVINPENGILVHSSDEKECTRAILEISNGRYYYNQQLIAQNASDAFSYKTIGMQLARVYDRLLNNPAN
jgi:glycosyltransferase involved in cell wall biosynthesis